MAVFTTEKFEDGTIGWLYDDTDLFWLNALDGVAPGLIARITASPVAIRGKFIDKKSMQIIFCSVLKFNHDANKLSPNLINIMGIKRKTLSDLLTLAHVKPHNYDQDSNEDNIKIPSSSLFSSTVSLFAFVQSVLDTNNIFTNFLWLYQYIKPAQRRVRINNKKSILIPLASKPFIT